MLLNSLLAPLPLEAGKLIFQLGTSSPSLAVQAAKKVSQDVDGIDVNMGCPKKFSIQGGMGAALLRDPDKACDIIKALKVEIKNIPISAKIRLVGERGKEEEGWDLREDELFENTKIFMKKLQVAGVDSIAVHARTTSDSSHDLAAKPRWGRVKELVDSVNVPVLVNGDIYKYEDVREIRETTGAAGVMIARGALRNTR